MADDDDDEGQRQQDDNSGSNNNNSQDYSRVGVTGGVGVGGRTNGNLRGSTIGGRTKRQKKDAPSSEDRSIPFNCSMPYSDFVKLEDEAFKTGINRSELLRRALQFYYHYKQPRASEEERGEETTS